MKKFLLATFLLLCFFTKAVSQSESAFSLKQAIEYAKANNANAKNAKLDEKASLKKIHEIRAIGLPQVSASGRFVYTPQIPTIGIKNPGFFGPNPTVEFPQGIDYSINGTLSANQLLFDGSFLMGLKAAKEYALLARINSERTDKQIASDVTKAYFLVIITEENIKLIDKNIQTLEKILSDMKALYKNGLIEKTDVDRIELAYSNTKVQSGKLQDAREITYYLLKLQMGYPGNQKISVTDKMQDIYSNLADADALAEENVVYANRPEYKMLEQQIKMQTLDKKRYQFGYAPSLVAFAQHQQNAFAVDFGSLNNRYYPGTQIGLNLSLPIFDGFMKNSQIEQARINIQKTQNQKSQFESAIETEVFSNRTKYLRAKEQIQVQKKNMELAEEIYNKVNIKFSNGVGSSLELSQAETDLKTAQTNYLNAIYDLLVAKTDLEQSLGK
jgi:outer membrane protein